jgi:hypothetical protein
MQSAFLVNCFSVLSADYHPHAAACRGSSSHAGANGAGACSGSHGSDSRPCCTAASAAGGPHRPRGHRGKSRRALHEPLGGVPRSVFGGTAARARPSI